MTPTTYIVQKKVIADSVQDALAKEPSTPINSVFPDTSPNQGSPADAVGFKYVPVEG
jgi:hypothetical protein